MSKKIFITGIAGCVGHYLYDELKDHPEFHLYCLVRRPERIKFDYKNDPRFQLLDGWLEDIEKYADLLKECDALVHIAAGWGVEDVNYNYTLKLFRLLDPVKCRKIIYFSTASILGKDNKPIKETLEFGTPYIKGKYKIYKEIKKLRNLEILFPTAVIGGDQNHPFSHVAEAFALLPKWIKLVRFFSFDGGFHFIHAQDVAKVAKYLLEHETDVREYVLGNDYITFDELIDQACRHLKVNTYPKIPIPINFILFLIRIFRIKIDPWSYFSLSYRHFKYQVTRVRDFGIESNFEELEKIIKEYVKL